MVRGRFYILNYPVTKAEDTIAWFWSGINPNDYSNIENLMDPTYKYLDFCNNYKRKVCNQSS